MVESGINQKQMADEQKLRGILAGDLKTRYNLNTTVGENQKSGSFFENAAARWSGMAPAMARMLVGTSLLVGTPGVSMANTLAIRSGAGILQTDAAKTGLEVKPLVETAARGATEVRTEASSGTLLEQWKQKMDGSRNSDKAVETLKELLDERGIGLFVGNQAASYAHMHLVATMVSLLEQGLKNSTVSLTDVFKSINVADAQQVRDNSLVIPKDAAGFFATNRFIRAFMNQVSLSAATEIAKRTPGLLEEIEALRELPLLQTEELQKNPELLLAVCIQNFMLKGEVLKSQIQGRPGQDQAKLEAAYKALQAAFGGKEYGEADLNDLSAAILNMEKDGGLQMAQALEKIGSIKDKADITQAEQEFQLRFGSTLAEYRKVIDKPLGLKIMEQGLFKGFVQAERLKSEPFKVTDRASFKFAATGAAMGILTVGVAFVA